MLQVSFTYLSIAHVKRSNARCSRLTGKIREDSGSLCPRCRGLARPIDGCPVTEVVIGDKTLDVVDLFYYLGDTLSSGGVCTSAIINRCKVAWSKIRKWLSILTSRNLSLLVCGRVYYSCVRPTMLYSGETWAPNVSYLQHLQHNDRAMLG